MKPLPWGGFQSLIPPPLPAGGGRRPSAPAAEGTAGLPLLVHQPLPCCAAPGPWPRLWVFPDVPQARGPTGGRTEPGRGAQAATGPQSQRPTLGARTWLWGARAASQDRPGSLGPGFHDESSLNHPALRPLSFWPGPARHQLLRLHMGPGPQGVVTRYQWGELCPRGADPCPALSALSRCWDSVSPWLVFM